MNTLKQREAFKSKSRFWLANLQVVGSNQSRFLLIGRGVISYFVRCYGDGSISRLIRLLR